MFRKTVISSSSTDYCIHCTHLLPSCSCFNQIISPHPLSTYTGSFTYFLLSAYYSDVFDMMTVVVTVRETSFRSCTTNVRQPYCSISRHITRHHVTTGKVKHSADNSAHVKEKKGRGNTNVKLYGYKFYLLHIDKRIYMQVRLQVSL